jgi:PAS domain S-box-containing protein
VREVEYTAKGNALPERHVLALRDKSPRDKSVKFHGAAGAGEDPAWMQDYALFLFDADGRVVGWYSGAERIYGYQSQEIVGQPVSCLYPDEDALGIKLKEELKRAAAQGHFGSEDWHIRKDGSRFWANVFTMALRDESGELRGFGRVVRDFSKRHLAEEKLRPGGVLRLLSRVRAKESTIAGVVSGEFDHITDANDAFLQIVGYSREDLVADRLYWPDLTPTEYLPLDEEAHEEGMRYGALHALRERIHSQRRNSGERSGGGRSNEPFSVSLDYHCADPNGRRGGGETRQRRRDRQF